MRRASALPVSWIRASVGAFTVIMIQLAVFDQVLIGGLVEVQLPLLLVVAVAMLARTDEAALFGFHCGLLVDLFHVGPFGQFALAYCLVAAAVAAGAARRRAQRLDAHSAIHRFAQRCLISGTAAIASSLVISVVALVVAGSTAAVTSVVELADLSAVCGSVLVIHPVARAVRAAGVLRSRGRIPFDLAGRGESIIGHGPVTLGSHD